MTSFREWLTMVRRYGEDFDAIAVGDLLKAYEGANGADEHAVLDGAVASAPEDVAKRMRAYFGSWQGEWPGLRKDGRDPLGRTVRRVYVMTDRFVIYSADDSDCDEDVCSLRYALREGYQLSRAMRQKLTAFSPQVSYIADAVCSMRPIFSPESAFLRFRERIFEMLALAMSSALEDQPEKAQLVLDQTRTSVEDRRASVVRMRYMAANTVSAALLLAAGMVILLQPGWFPPMPHFLSLAAGAEAGAAGAVSLPVLPVLMAGALGSFFSVALSLRSLVVSWSITPTEVLFSGFVRVWIGVIAAGAVIWIVDGRWLLASVENAAMPATVMLLGFIAGFSEMFVPNALKTIEDQTQVRHRGAGAETTVDIVRKPGAAASGAPVSAVPAGTAELPAATRAPAHGAVAHGPGGDGEVAGTASAESEAPARGTPSNGTPSNGAQPGGTAAKRPAPDASPELG